MFQRLRSCRKSGEERGPDVILTHDLTTLPQLTLPHVLDCLLERYAKGLYYTYAGPILISLNPCLPPSSLPPLNALSHYNHAHSTPTKEPHVYSLGHLCLKSLLSLGQNQVVVVSGDSGAGKTTATQQLLSFFIQKSKEGTEELTPTTLDKKIYLATLVLESLGNARTAANGNSSRFGRFVQLEYLGGCGGIGGASIRTVLLEKHRVPKCAVGERNFHIFYYVLAGLQRGLLSLGEWVEEEELVREWKSLVPPELLSGVTERDEAQFLSLHNSLSALGMGAELERVFQVVVGLLFLLNLRLRVQKEPLSPRTPEQLEDDLNGSETEEIVPEDERVLQLAAELFRLNPADLLDVLVTRTIRVTHGGPRRQSIFRKPCESVRGCEERLWSLGSALYEALFLYVLARLNGLLRTRHPRPAGPGGGEGEASPLPASPLTLSLLDLYGFENLGTNHLETLCINYANERLQQVQIKALKAHLEEVEGAEGVYVPLELLKVEAEGLQRLTELHETLFSVLNEACLLNRGSCDREIFERLLQASKDSKYLTPGKVQDPSCPFRVLHYAAPVSYQLRGMVSKNTDRIPSEFGELLGGSSSLFVRSLLREGSEGGSGSGSLTPCPPTPLRGKGRRERTILQRFRGSVEALVSELVSDECQEVRFIRCIRPNETLTEGQVDYDLVKRQLSSAGITDVLRITANSLPIRLPRSKFGREFPGTLRRFMRGPFEAQVLFDRLGLGSDEVKGGQSQVFMKERTWAFLKELESLIRTSAATRIQRVWRDTLRTQKAASKAECLVEFPEKRSMSESPGPGGGGDTWKERPEAPRAPSSVKRLSRCSAQTLSRLMRDLNLRRGEGIVSRGQIHKGPLKFHVRRTPLPFSHRAPRSQGLNEVLSIINDP